MTYHAIQDLCTILNTLSGNLSKPLLEGLLYATIRSWCDHHHEDELALLQDLTTYIIHEKQKLS